MRFFYGSLAPPKNGPPAAFSSPLWKQGVSSDLVISLFSIGLTHVPRPCPPHPASCLFFCSAPHCPSSFLVQSSCLFARNSALFGILPVPPPPPLYEFGLFPFHDPISGSSLDDPGGWGCGGWGFSGGWLWGCWWVGWGGFGGGGGWRDRRSSRISVFFLPLPDEEILYLNFSPSPLCKTPPCGPLPPLFLPLVDLLSASNFSSLLFFRNAVSGLPQSRDFRQAPTSLPGHPPPSTFVSPRGGEIAASHVSKPKINNSFSFPSWIYMYPLLDLRSFLSSLVRKSELHGGYAFFPPYPVPLRTPSHLKRPPYPHGKVMAISPKILTFRNCKHLLSLGMREERFQD